MTGTVAGSAVVGTRAGHTPIRIDLSGHPPRGGLVTVRPGGKSSNSTHSSSSNGSDKSLTATLSPGQTSGVAGGGEVGGAQSGAPPVSNKTQATPIVMEQGGYSTALSVTIAIGCSLLILNMLIFAGVYYQLDKAKTSKSNTNSGNTGSNNQGNNGVNSDRTVSKQHLDLGGDQHHHAEVISLDDRRNQQSHIYGQFTEVSHGHGQFGFRG